MRGAGRTDKGVVAFDIPVRLLKLGEDTNHHPNNNTEEGEKCIVHLQEAYHQFSTNDTTAIRSNKSTIDQWQIQRAITTRLRCSDIAIRSVRMYTGCSITQQPFEARKNIKCKTYVYKLRFRRLAYIPTILHDV